MGIPVVNYTPSKGNDKHARVNAVAPLFESGMVWAPEEKFAEEEDSLSSIQQQLLHNSKVEESGAGNFIKILRSDKKKFEFDTR